MPPVVQTLILASLIVFIGYILARTAEFFDD